MNLTDSQKKIVGIAVIIIFGAIELIFLALLIYTLVTGESASEQAFSFVFVMGIFAVPLRWGIRLWRSSMSNAKASRQDDTSAPATDGSSAIYVQTKIDLPEYRRMIFYNTYTHPVLIFVHFLGISFIVYYFISGASDWFALFVTIFLLYLPVSIYRTARSNYESSKTVHEQLSYTFNAHGVSVIGETVNFSIEWRSLFKICETKRWFLLYTNKQSAMLIPKSDFTSELDIKRFREIIPVDVVREGIRN